MKATVISVAPNLIFKKKSGDGTYTAMMFKYQPDPYQGKEQKVVERIVFENAPIHDDLLDLKPGDYVDLKFEKSGKFTNIVGFEKLKKPAAPQQVSTPGPQEPYVSPADHRNTGVAEIAAKANPKDLKMEHKRNLLDISSSLVQKIMETGEYFKKKTEPVVYANVVVDIARIFYSFITGKDNAAAFTPGALPEFNLPDVPEVSLPGAKTATKGKVSKSKMKEIPTPPPVPGYDDEREEESEDLESDLESTWDYDNSDDDDGDDDEPPF